MLQIIFFKLYLNLITYFLDDHNKSKNKKKKRSKYEPIF